MKTVYLVRHGQVATNVDRLFQGPDGGLTELGIQQTKFIAERAAALPLEALIASPYERTRQSAEYIAKATGLTPEFNELFVECRVPSALWGKPEQSPEGEAYFAAQDTRYGPGFKYADEETFEEHTARARAALDMLAARPEQHIAVVTHGAFLKVLLAHVVFDGAPAPAEIRRFITHLDTQNTGITLVTHDPARRIPWKLFVYNDHAHLAE